ncbi:MAG: hypothetical protein V4622_14665 [Bacteroidota bacterium]
MTPRLSKAMLTSHITFSVAWFGAVVAFLVLAITGLTSQDNHLARASLIAMELCAWFVIVPFCLISLFTGIVQAIGTKWGLFKHYWIIVKLFLTVGSTLLLLLHMQPISYLAGEAKAASFSNSQYAEQIINLISKAGAAVIVLLIIITISIHKPWGKIQVRQNNKYTIKMQDKDTKTKKSWTFYTLIGLVVLIIIFIISHLFGGGMHGH